MPGHLLEGNPVDEDTKRRVTDTPVHRPQRPAGSTHSSTRGLRPPEQLERGTPQDEAGFMRKFETTHVGGAKC